MSKSNSVHSDPTLTRRKDGLTYKEGAERQSKILDQYYIDGDRDHEVQSSPSLSQRLRKMCKKREAPSSSDEYEAGQPKKSKPAMEPASADNSTNDTDTPSRRSERVRTKRKPFDNSEYELESPLSKKAKKQPAKPMTMGVEEPSLKDARFDRHAGSGNKSIWTPINRQLRQSKGHATSRQAKALTECRAKTAKAKQDSAKVSNDVASITADHQKEGSKIGELRACEKAEAAPQDLAKERQKKQNLPVFKGTGTGMGTSAEKPADAPNNVAWNCAKRDCTSGQTWYNRDGNEPYGRKSISQFFGRNKKETNAIPPDVWHNFCRKDYQREKYKADKGGAKSLSKWQIKLIRAQLLRIKLWRPEAEFKIQLSSNMLKRKGDWFQFKRRNGNNMAKTQADFEQAYPRKRTKCGELKPLTPEEAFPNELAENFDRTFCGEEKDFDSLEDIVVWIEGKLDEDAIEQMPPMEFLINSPKDDEKIDDPTRNYTLWAAVEDQTAEFAEDESESKADVDDEISEDKDHGTEASRKKQVIADTATQALQTLDDSTNNEDDTHVNGQKAKAFLDLFNTGDTTSDENDVTESEENDDEDDYVEPEEAYPSIDPRAKPSPHLRFVGDPKNYRRQSSTYGFPVYPCKRKRDDGGDENPDGNDKAVAGPAPKKVMK